MVSSFQTSGSECEDSELLRRPAFDDVILHIRLSRGRCRASVPSNVSTRLLSHLNQRRAEMLPMVLFCFAIEKSNENKYITLCSWARRGTS